MRQEDETGRCDKEEAKMRQEDAKMLLIITCLFVSSKLFRAEWRSRWCVFEGSRRCVFEQHVSLQKMCLRDSFACLTLLLACALGLALKCTLFTKDGVQVYVHLDASRVCKSIIWLQLEACAAAFGQSA